MKLAWSRQVHGWPAAAPGPDRCVDCGRRTDGPWCSYHRHAGQFTADPTGKVRVLHRVGPRIGPRVRLLQAKDISDALVCHAIVAEGPYHGPTLTRREWAGDILMRWTGAPAKVVRAAIRRAHNHGVAMVDGSAEWTGYLTDKGRVLLEAHA